jgi:hypothetical protein
MGGEQHWRLHLTVNQTLRNTGFDSLTTHHIEAHYLTWSAVTGHRKVW